MFDLNYFKRAKLDLWIQFQTFPAPLAIQRTPHSHAQLIQHMRVDHRRAHIAMPLMNVFNPARSPRVVHFFLA